MKALKSVCLSEGKDRNKQLSISARIMGSSADGISAVCFCLMLCISLIVYIIQIATDPTPPPGPSGGIPGNTSTLHSCAHQIIVHNKTYTLECGGKCKKEDGVCNPEYDGCVGKKYVAVKCQNGLPCVYKTGTSALKSDCEGICGPDGVCQDAIAYISNGEIEFNLTMSAVHSFLFVTIVLLSWHLSKINKDVAKSIYFWPVCCGIFCIVSWSFMIAASSDKLEGKPTQYRNRLITMISFATIYVGVGMVNYRTTLVYATGKVEKLTWFIHTKLHMMFFVLLVLDMVHCGIGNSQALLETIEALHPNVSANSKCYEEEYFAYVYGILVFGIFTYILTIADFYAVARDMDNLESIHVFLLQLSIPSFVTWIIFISFGYNCKDTGMTRIFSFGVTFTAFYSVFISYYAWHWFKHYVWTNEDQSENFSDNVAAVATPVEKDSTSDTASTYVIAKAWSKHINILHNASKENESLCGRIFLNPAMLGLVVVGIQFLLVGWYFYGIREELKVKYQV